MERRSRRLTVGAIKHKQSGFALYIMLILAILVSVQLMSSQLNAQLSNHKTERQQRLKFAKENLIALAVNYASNYGPSGAGPFHLPCPNQKIPDGSRTTEGPDTPCSGDKIVVGRLPRLVGIDHQQRTLNYQPDQYDAQNALWYIVSTNFVNNPFKKVNIETLADLSFNGLQSIVAVVLDAGPALSAQMNMRPSSDFQAYLELSRNGSDIVLDDGSNDRFLVITLNDIMPLVSARVGVSVARWLDDYRSRNCTEDYLHQPCFPWAAITPDGNCTVGALDGWISVEVGDCAEALFEEGDIEQVPRWAHWFIRNEWLKHIRYHVDETCVAALFLDCKVTSGTVMVDGINRLLMEVEPRG